MPIKTASAGDPRLYPHLRREARPARRGTPCCDHAASRQPRPTVGPWPHLRRRSRGVRGRARIAATAHHGRLRGRSAAPLASPYGGASNAPQIDLEEEVGGLWWRPVSRQHGCRKTGQLWMRADRHHWPPQPPPRAISSAIDISGVRSAEPALETRAATAYAAASADRPSLAAARATLLLRPRADRRRCSPRPPLGAICGAIRVYGTRYVECAAARRAATVWRAASRGRASARGSAHAGVR